MKISHCGHLAKHIKNKRKKIAMKYDKLTLQEKTELTNKYISLYRKTNDMKFKNLAFEIIESDVRGLCHAKFYSYKAMYEDILQEMFLEVSKQMNVGTSFDPERGVYIVLYLQKDLVNKGREMIDKSKTPTSFSPKHRVAVIKKLQAIADELGFESIQDALPTYIERKYPDMSDGDRHQKEYELNNLLQVTTSQQIPDDCQEDDAIRSQLVDESSDFTKDFERIHAIVYRYQVAIKLFRQKKLSKLQFLTFRAVFLAGAHKLDLSKSDLAEAMNMSRQNFCRAFNDAKAVIEKYLETHGEEN